MNNSLRIYTYPTIRPSNYLVDHVGLRNIILGLKGELKQDLLGIYYAGLFKWWIDAGILDIFKEEFNIYAYYLHKTAKKEDNGIL